MFIGAQYLATYCIDKIIGHKLKYPWNPQKLMPNCPWRTLMTPLYILLQITCKIFIEKTFVRKIWFTLISPDVASASSPGITFCFLVQKPRTSYILSWIPTRPVASSILKQEIEKQCIIFIVLFFFKSTILFLTHSACFN